MDGFGEIYVWPKGQEDGKNLPEDFWERLGRALESEDIGWETV